MSVLNVGLVGMGTVGGGTATVLVENGAAIEAKTGVSIRITHAADLNTDLAKALPLENAIVSDDAFALVAEPDVDVVVELIGGYTVAKDVIMQAIANGKHVVTANKALMALHGNEIFAAAQEQNVMVAFEAAVAGGIPIIKALREGLAANQVSSIAGIINGTGNFILTEMRNKQREFDDVLNEAQALGYAEADPTFDIEGHDAAHKLTLLSSIAYGIPLQFDQTYLEGIAKVTPEDINSAEELGYSIKHLGIARKTEQGIEQRVHPTLIPHDSLVSKVDGVMNAVYVQGNAVGSTMYYGPGAGDMATASAVVADLMDIARGSAALVPQLGYHTMPDNCPPVLPIESVNTAYYLRMCAEDKPGVLAEVTQVLGQKNISIEAFLQKEPKAGSSQVDIILISNRVREGDMLKAIAEIEQLQAICSPVTHIRMETLAD